MRKICKICGVPENEHHIPVWLVIPDSCVCDPFTWDTAWNYSNASFIPEPCLNYKGNKETTCENCEHDFECHKKK